MRRGEPAVEAAVERDAGDDRDQDRRDRRDHREQADDAHMQPRAGAAAPARLHDVPDFAADDADQQQRRERVDRQHGDDDLMGRRDRRQPGEHHEGDGGRQQRQRRPRSIRSRAPTAAAPRRRESSEIATSSALVIATPGSAENSAESDATRVTARRRARADLMHLYNNVAELRQFRGSANADVLPDESRSARPSPAGADHLDVQVADLLAQRVAVDARAGRRRGSGCRASPRAPRTSSGCSTSRRMR